MQTIPEVLIQNLEKENIAEFLRLNYPDRDDQVFSYSEVFDDVQKWMVFYQSRGIEKENTVVIILKHSLDLYSSYLAALCLGIIPSYFAFPSEKLSEDVYFKSIEELIGNANPELIIVYEELRKTLESAGLSEKKLASPEELDKAVQKRDLLKIDISVDAPAFLQYSSGTTGAKKGVIVSQSSLLCQIEDYSEAIKVSKEDIIISWLPLYHDMGLITSFFIPFIKRIPLIALAPHDWVKEPSSLLDLISKHKATLCWLPNFAYSFISQRVDGAKKWDLSSIRGFVNCSEPIISKSQEDFLSRFQNSGMTKEKLATSYAMAENTFAISSGGFGQYVMEDSIDYPIFLKSGKAIPIPKEKFESKTLVSSGTALPKNKIKIINKKGETLAERECGEIVIASPYLMKEYHKNPGETKNVMRDGNYYTGDLGYLTGGHLFVTGRKKDLIIIGGVNIYPQDIENLISRVEGVLPGRCVAFGIPNKILGTEKLVILAEIDEKSNAENIEKKIYSLVKTNTEVTLSDLKLYKSRCLEKSSAGKISRSGNKKNYLNKQDDCGNKNVSVDEEASSLNRVRQCAIRSADGQSSIKIKALAPEDAFLSSGLTDSFFLAVFLSELEKEFKTTVSAKLVSENPQFDSLEGIAKILDCSDDTINGDDEVYEFDIDYIQMINNKARSHKCYLNFWTLYYKIIFMIMGISYGKGLRVRGPLFLRIEGKASNIIIGNNVTLMPWVEFKNRENGKIILHDGVMLDSQVRVVAANDATVEFGQDVGISIGSNVCGGMDIKVGRNTLVAGGCTLMTSDHGSKKGTPICEQAYEHAPIYIADDVWLGAGVFIGKGSKIAPGAILGAYSVLNGSVPPNSISLGCPARVINYRKGKE